MNMNEYIANTKANLPEGLANTLLNQMSIWTNEACYGYCIHAMEKAGYEKKDIDTLLHYLHRAFGVLSVEEAEQKYRDY